MKAIRRPLAALAAGLVAGLACSLSPSSGEDISATVNAVSTSVQQTVVAQTPPAIFTISPPSTAASTQPPVNPTQPPPPAPTLTSAPLPTPTGELSRPNGPVIHAAHLPTPPRVDGDLNEWTLYSFINQVVYRPENWVDAADQSAAFAVGWDSQYLYLAVQLTDDRHVQTEHGELIFKGDSLELLLDADLSGDYSDARLSADDFQLGLSPGSLIAEPAEVYLWFPVSREGKPQGVSVAAQPYPAPEGYWLEAAIPWSLFNIIPAPGDRFGFALSSSDNDNPSAAEQQTMVSTVSTRRLTDPTTWGTLALDN
ncbi:MAG TPA: sugar-binding protein [Anaerolineales bacterium]|nr:sugar-binding protein [Anaerolineales bacterium]